MELLFPKVKNLYSINYLKRNLSSFKIILLKKIIPTVLTILPTMVNLITYVLEGQNEACWFSFVADSIGGLLFPLLGIFVYLPMIIDEKDIRNS